MWNVHLPGVTVPGVFIFWGWLVATFDSRKNGNLKIERNWNDKLDLLETFACNGRIKKFKLNIPLLPASNNEHVEYICIINRVAIACAPSSIWQHNPNLGGGENLVKSCRVIVLKLRHFIHSSTSVDKRGWPGEIYGETFRNLPSSNRIVFPVINRFQRLSVERGGETEFSFRASTSFLARFIVSFRHYNRSH